MDVVTSADEWNEKGLALEEQGDVSGAEAAYKAAIEADAQFAPAYYNVGLLCKYQSRWRESFDFNRQAASIDGQNQATWWNLGIAATALGEWAEARRAWTQCGLTVPDGDGPPVFNFGSTPVRLDPDGEVVWAHRIDPARARILNVPLPSSSYNAGDMVLTDGAADGHRKIGGVEYPVFNVLAVLQRSSLRKYIVELGTLDQPAIATLERLASELGGAAENWARTTNFLCAECSRGVPHEHVRKTGQPAHPHCGLAARDADHAEEILRAWLEQEAGADLVRWYDAATSDDVASRPGT